VKVWPNSRNIKQTSRSKHGRMVARTCRCGETAHRHAHGRQRQRPRHSGTALPPLHPACHPPHAGVLCCCCTCPKQILLENTTCTKLLMRKGERKVLAYWHGTASPEGSLLERQPRHKSCCSGGESLPVSELLNLHDQQNKPPPQSANTLCLHPCTCTT
jgi:hypothetical protein